MEQRKKLEYPWATDLDTVLSDLQSSRSGITHDEALRRQKEYGKNIFHKKEKINAFTIFLKQLASPLIFILITAVVLTAVLHEWIEVVVIALAVLINTGLGFYREYHAENTLEKLRNFIKDRSRVIREGKEKEIDSDLLVPGDIIKLSYGGRVPADSRVLSTNNFRVDEAILTGESVPVQKSTDSVSVSALVAERSNMVHAGTLVVDGFATCVVVSTGDNTEIGKIAGLVSSTHRAETPIQKGLNRLAWIIFFIVLFIVAGIFLLGVSRGESIFDMLILSVAVSIGAVPEALPIALTVILSIGAERIAKKRGVARTLIAAETLGSTSLIMTDKTGTLTEANMNLVGVYSTEDILKGDSNRTELSDRDRDLVEMALRNINVIVENPAESQDKWVFKGSHFESNIAKIARDNGMDLSQFTSGGVSPIIMPFNSTNKFSVSSHNSEFVVMGAPDILLSRSSVDAHTFQKIESWITTASAEGKRLIAIAKLENKVGNASDVKDVLFMGVLVFHDPVRKEVPAAIKKIESFGIKVVIVTGDLKGTALSVAHELGWNVMPGEILTGGDLQAMDDEQLRTLIPTIKIFARVTPEDKLRIGRMYRSLGEVVAMTGDGVNDAPSLKAMDIGVALGSGSDVAKSAADLVLLDDNFQTISLAVLEGRRILANIRKTFVYLMSNSLDEVFVVGGSLLVGVALPLTALQIIWVNLFTGSLPALAFAYDQDLDHEKAGRHTLKSIFTREVNILTFVIGVLSSLFLFFMYVGLIRYGVEPSLARSVFFVCFASYILVIAFSFRSLHKPLFSYPVFSNKKLNQSILIAVGFLVATMTVSPLRGLFALAPLPLMWLWFVAGWLVFNIALVEFAKLLFRVHKARSYKTF